MPYVVALPVAVEWPFVVTLSPHHSRSNALHHCLASDYGKMWTLPLE